MRGVLNHKPGDIVGELTLLRNIPGKHTPRIPALWVCRCSCGNEVEVRTGNLNSGRSRSCGHARHGGFNV